MHNPVWSGAADEFSDKGACNIVLLNLPEGTRNQTPQPTEIGRRVDIAGDDARTENRQALEANPLDGFFFQAHDPPVADPAFCGASRRREQSKPRDASGVTTTGKTADNANFQSLQFLL